MRLSQPHHKSWERFFLVQPVQLNFCRTGICDEAESASSQILGTIFILIQVIFVNKGFVMRLSQPHHKSLERFFLIQAYPFVLYQYVTPHDSAKKSGVCGLILGWDH